MLSARAYGDTRMFGLIARPALERLVSRRWSPTRHGLSRHRTYRL